MLLFFDFSELVFAAFCFTLFCFSCFLPMQEIKPKDLPILGKHLTTEPYPQQIGIFIYLFTYLF
jgi:hypothetical protein